jgi:AraC-like DNA-binding protein
MDGKLAPPTRWSRAMDPLSDVLSLLKPRNYMSAGVEIGGPWAIQFPAQHRAIKTGVVVRGDCWISVDGIVAPTHFQVGDCFLLPSGRAFRMASDLSLPPVEAPIVFGKSANGQIRMINGGGDDLIISSRFILEGDQADMLLGMLPAIVHLRDKGEKSALRHSVEKTMEEMRRNGPGSALVLQHLAHMMLVQALRQHLDSRPEGGVGWFFALADKQIAAAIGAIHNDPAHPWTVESLARTAHMSRSAFAAKFKEIVGQSPMSYLTRWRMALAGDRLTQTRDPVSVIALSLGYESESAFSTAFKRTMGVSPRQYGRKTLNPANVEPSPALHLARPAE